MPRELSAPMMGSTAHVTVNGGPYALAEIALARLDELQSKWNRFQATSELCRLNSNRGSFLPVSPETYRLIAEAVHGWWRSDGRGPGGSLWGGSGHRWYGSARSRPALGGGSGRWRSEPGRAGA